MDKQKIYRQIELSFKNIKNFSKENIVFFNSFNCINKVHNEVLTKNELKEYLLEKIELLKKINPQYAQIIEERFLKEKSAINISQTLFLSKDQVNRYKRAGLIIITDLISDEEEKSRSLNSKEFLKQIPPLLTEEIVGHNELLNDIYESILDDNNQKFIVLSGIGGIGKTTIINHLIRKIINETYKFKSYHWIRIPNQTNNDYRNIEKIIKEKINEENKDNAIIIIDNVSHKKQYMIIINVLNQYINQTSKIIITSRYRPVEISNEKLFWLPEIAKADFNELILSLMKMDEGSKILNKSQLNNIYELIGGNPFAIKMIASLLRIYPFHNIVNELKNCEIDNIETLYKSVFWKTWQSLSEESKNCLVAMPIFLDIGISIEQIQKITNQSSQQILFAIKQLFEFSLIELRGSFEEKYYGIHHLTNSFINSEIINEPITLEK